MANQMIEKIETDGAKAVWRMYQATNGVISGLPVLSADEDRITRTLTTKYCNSATGTAITDGLDVGITADGTAEIRQRENLPLVLYTNNQSRITIDANGGATLSSLAGAITRTVIVDSTGKLVADAKNPPSMVGYGSYNYTAIYGINYTNSATGGQKITLPLAIEGYSVEILSKTQGVNAFMSMTGTDKIYDINGNDVTATYTATFSLNSIKRIKLVALKQMDRVAYPLNSGKVDWVVTELAN